jgi:trehalose 6-phosphate phosphatase
MDLLTRLSKDPSLAALFLDVDGVLAPIVPRPEDARVPEETRTELRRLNGRYALVACISGRAGADAAVIVGLPELVYVGNHGLELLPAAEQWRERLRTFLTGVEWPRLEDKGLTAARAHEAGLVARFGRKVLEIVPPVHADKGTAIRSLLAERGLRRALAAGDDTTDLDAFRALDGLEVGVRVAVASDEGPPELRQAADVVVHGTAELLSLLRRL